MTWEEFLARAREIRVLDKELWRQLRSLYVDGGTLQQLVRALLDTKEELQEGMANCHMISEESVRRAIGLQGQIMGLQTALQVVHELMQEPQEVQDEQVS